MKQYLLLLFCFIVLLSSCSPASTQQPPATTPIVSESENLAPVISSLSAGSQAEPQSQLVITCEAIDPEGGNLNYKWEVTGGKIDGIGATVTWTTPQQSGDYFIKVSVSDNHSATSSKQLAINVPDKPNNNPVITAFVFTRESHLPITIKMNATEKEKAKTPELIIKKYETAELSCVAEDPDGDKLDYLWMTSGGKIRESGPMVYWVVPGEAGNYTITVEVSDGRGGTDSYTTKVTVKCCGI